MDTQEHIASIIAATGEAAQHRKDALLRVAGLQLPVLLRLGRDLAYERLKALGFDFNEINYDYLNAVLGLERENQGI